MKLTLLIIATACVTVAMSKPPKNPSTTPSYEPENTSDFIRREGDEEGEGDDIRLTAEQREALAKANPDFYASQTSRASIYEPDNVEDFVREDGDSTEIDSEDDMILTDEQRKAFKWDEADGETKRDAKEKKD